jgi:multidrug efflux pump subunit AcrB
LKDARTPWLIGVSVPTSLVVSFLFFYLFGVSINIVSLSGLILGVGMMIDNSIIVIDNIVQYMDRGESLTRACIKGTNEVIGPLVSSLLSTCAVFVPLVFLSGISGALFFDQAISVAIGLVASLMVSVTLIPVLFHLWFGRANKKGSEGRLSGVLRRLDLFKLEAGYERAFHFTFTHRRTVMVLFTLLLVPAVYWAIALPKQRFPDFERSEAILHIDWNDKISLDENHRRVDDLYAAFKSELDDFNAYIGGQQYLFHKDLDLSISEASVYIRCGSSSAVQKLQQKIPPYLASRYSQAIATFEVPPTVFEKVFGQEEPLLVARISDNKTKGVPPIEKMAQIVDEIGNQAGFKPDRVATDSYIEIRALPEMLALYQVEQSLLTDKLKAALNSRHVGVLHTGSQYVPMVIGLPAASVQQILGELRIDKGKGQSVPLSALVTTRQVDDYKNLYGSNQGAYVPVAIDTLSRSVSSLTADIRNELKAKFDVDTLFTGSYFANRALMKELLIVLLISLAMLYFILAAQFESLTQPLILLIEIPIDIAGALFMLWLFGGSINIMSMIGIVVMSGIVVNDSILKIDTINRLRKEGMPLMEAIHTGGVRRLKPIIMTSLTTILALAPVLWGSGIGNELQKPLALTLIGSMVLGTIVSLFFIPLCYYYLNRHQSPTIPNNC